MTTWGMKNKRVIGYNRDLILANMNLHGHSYKHDSLQLAKMQHSCIKTTNRQKYAYLFLKTNKDISEIVNILNYKNVVFYIIKM